MILGREPCYGQVSKFEFRVSTYFLSGTVHDAVVNTYENWLLKKNNVSKTTTVTIKWIFLKRIPQVRKLNIEYKLV